ncbi:rhomboid family intramembrane serine protease [Nitrogeniibacter mangrovi]|uniref:Rhomboid family intramembrane serine protease n=1 Tax=Nitrogeniibacter mangrovi TaxID=2016596 RepID=A0A6C1B7J5_9RHOO|nr:rhomboid family intramembrane serine protease [Nitrogeniibacter mangrovi]QID18919.1 rhomboid family intramembrane serine protease [Nitrogeniibacter mangrovi]
MSAPRHSTPEAFLDALYAHVPRAWVTTALVAINFLVFAATAVQADALWHIPGSLLADWGGNYAVQTREGQLWRLFTGLFLHGGLLHVALNMLALYQAGQLAERLFGPRRFTLIYVAAGLVASVASVWWRPNGLSIGASGAIFGVFGALLSHVLVTRTSLPPDTFRRLRKALVIFIGYSLIAGLVLPGIDNAAHVGGLISGVLLGAGLAVPVGDARVPRVRFAGALAVVALAAGTLWFVTPPVRPALTQSFAFNAVAAQVAEREEQLVQRYHFLADALRQGQIDDAAAVDILDRELIPAWRQLEDEVATGGQGDWRAGPLLRYLAARREALEALEMAIQTHQRRWIERSNALQARADEYLLDYRMLLAPGGDGRRHAEFRGRSRKVRMAGGGRGAYRGLLNPVGREA